jgi:predicted HTH transcriptional regulator
MTFLYVSLDAYEMERRTAPQAPRPVDGTATIVKTTDRRAPADACQMTERREAIIDALTKSVPLTARELAKKIGEPSVPALRQSLRIMAKQGMIKQRGSIRTKGAPLAALWGLP